MNRDEFCHLVAEIHPFIAPQGNSPKKTRYHLVLPKRYRFVMDDSKFL